MSDDKNLHAGHRQRLKNMVRESGLEGLSSYQVLENLLYYALPQRDTNVLAHRLIDHFGSLPAVLDADYEELLLVNGVGPNTASLLTLMPALFRRYRADAATARPILGRREQAVEYLRSVFLGKSYEEFYMICLDSSFRINKPVLLNKGTLTQVAVYPRVAVETALRHKASYVLLAHNHPGGRPQPTSDDLHLTDALRGVLEAMSIKVLDHIIISADQYFSFAEKGLLPQRY